MRKTLKNNGFTIIELLVVISIIALLSSIVMSSLSSARMKARDARRKADLHQIRLALAMYFNVYGRYPAQKNQPSCVGGTEYDWAGSNGPCKGDQWLTDDTKFYEFMPNVPIDPLNQGRNAGWGDGNNVYTYTSDSDQIYDLLTQLENTSDKDRCETRVAFRHQGGTDVPWCAPWVIEFTPDPVWQRSQNIYTDH